MVASESVSVLLFSASRWTERCAHLTRYRIPEHTEQLNIDLQLRETAGKQFATQQSAGCVAPCLSGDEV
jgi:hypothetical protein